MGRIRQLLFKSRVLTGTASNNFSVGGGGMAWSLDALSGEKVVGVQCQLSRYDNAGVLKGMSNGLQSSVQLFFRDSGGNIIQNSNPPTSGLLAYAPDYYTCPSGQIVYMNVYNVGSLQINRIFFVGTYVTAAAATDYVEVELVVLVESDQIDKNFL